MNHEAYIEQAIKSFIAQSYDNFEIFYLDNCSEDSCYEKGREILKQSSISFYSEKRKKSFSISENINHLLRMANGDFYCTMSCDDWMDKDNILEKINFLIANPLCGLVYSNGYTYNNETGSLKPIYRQAEKRLSTYDSLLIENNILGPGTMIKKSVIDDVGYFDERSKIEDWDMWIRISYKYEIGYLDNFLVYYRLAGNNVSLNEIYMWEGYHYIFKKNKALYDNSLNKKKIYEAYYKKHQRYINYLSEVNPSLNSLHLILKNPKLKIYYFREIIIWFLMILFSKKRVVFKHRY